MTYVVQAGEHPSYESLTDLLTDGWPEDTMVLQILPVGTRLASVSIYREGFGVERHLKTETSRSRAAERLLNKALADNEALTERLHELEAENAALRLADEPRRLALLNEMMEKMFGVRVEVT